MTIRASGYTVYKIGPNQELTPEGFLLCKDVPVARTGVMIYGPDETPIESGPDGLVKIYREDEDVFDARTIASAIGKPVTNDHPEEDVTPNTWKEQAVGVALHVRRGEGTMDDLLLMDLLITTKEGIEAVQGGKREISLGYDADYEQLEPGKGRQSNIIINHIALVEQGRCGARCAIKDKKPTNQEESQMANRYGTRKAQTSKRGLAKVVDLLFKAHKAKDAEELKEVLDEAANMDGLSEEENVGNLDQEFSPSDENGDTHIHIHNGGDQAVGEPDENDEGGRAEFQDDDDPRWASNESDHNEFRQRLEALEARIGKSTDSEESATEAALDDGEELEEFLEEEAPEGIPAKDARKARDSRYLGESMKDTVAMAEILAPGIKVPTYDSRSTPSITAKKICSLRRQALDIAYAVPANRAMFSDIIGNKKLDTSRMTCDAIRTVFKTASALKRQSNNGMGVRDSIMNLQAVKPAKPMTIEDINAANAAYYTSKK